MVERRAEVLGSEGGVLRLRPLGAACAGCDSGCGGRCNVFAGDDGGEWQLPLAPGQAWTRGQRLRLSIDDAALRRAAWAGYGLAGLGLLLGASAGAALALWPPLADHADALTSLGVVAGTLLAIRRSKRHLPKARLDPDDRGGDRQIPPVIISGSGPT